MENAPTKLTEGWTWIIGSPKWHYVRNFRSLCGRWLLLVMPEDIEQGNDTSKDNCMGCRRKLEKERAKNVVA